MGVSAGLVGLPNAGKSTLFNALTGAGAEVGAYPFTTVGRNVAVLSVPDERLARLAAITGPARVTPTSLETVDIAGLVRGAHRGEGLGNQFLGYIREVDIILHVVRSFENDKVAHVEGFPDPVRDAETVEIELALADLDTVERRLERARRRAKSGQPEELSEVKVLERFRDDLACGRPAAASPGPEADLLKELFLLTSKPTIYVGNLSDTAYRAALTGSGPEGWRALVAHARAREAPAVPVSAAVEAEWAGLPDDERDLWSEELGEVVRGGAALVRAAYEHLGLITFYTINENEARAHTVVRGTPVVRAAGKVHTDMERGFIRAEVIAAEDLERAGSMSAARRHGLLRMEGRDYVVVDGDIIQIRFAPTG